MTANRTPFRPLSWAKKSLVRPGRRPKKLFVGLFQGLRLNLDMAHDTQIYLGLWEAETHSYIRTASRRCSWLVDVGAGKGELCTYFAVQPNISRVIACEPDAAEIDVMKSNIRLNEERFFGSWEVFEKFVGTAGTANNVRLDELDIDRESPGFIKIDVDGFELDVLDSGAELLSACEIDLLVETHSKQLENDCIRFLRDKGYHCRIIANAWWRWVIPEQRPSEHNRWLWATKRV